MNRSLSVLALTVGMLAAGAGPAQAHHPIVSGESVCAEDGKQTITWTVTNSESTNGTNRSMTIDQVSIDRGSAPFTVGQTFPPTPQPGSSQDGVSTHGGAETGDVILTVRVDFTDGPQDVARAATVALAGGCEETTTTTTAEAPTTTTTEASTTTTACGAACEPPPGSCQSSNQPGCGPTTTTTVVPATTTTTRPPEILGVQETLPKTGGPTAPLLMVGLAFLFGGAALRAGRDRPTG